MDVLFKCFSGRICTEKSTRVPFDETFLSLLRLKQLKDLSQKTPAVIETVFAKNKGQQELQVQV